MPTHSFTPAELAPLSEVDDIHRRGLTHGYTGVSVTYKKDADGEFYEVILNEADDKTTVKTNLVAATIPSISLDVSDLQVVGDGVATGVITLTDSRGAGASGDTVDVTPGQAMALSSISLTFDGAGQSTITFGPSSSAGIKSPKMPLSFQYSDNKAAAVVATCQYT